MYMRRERGTRLRQSATTLFILAAVRVWRDTTFKFAKIMFGYSIFYLFGLFALMMIDRI